MDEQIRFELEYGCTWKFLNPERKSCGFKNTRIRVDGAKSANLVVVVVEVVVVVVVVVVVEVVVVVVVVQVVVVVVVW